MVLHSELSYAVRGVFIEVSRTYGPTHKERVYDRACREVFERLHIPFVAQPRVTIHSVETGKMLAVHVPDFVIDASIVVELKATTFLHRSAVAQLEQYLRASRYEVGLLVNFGQPRVAIHRRIYTNDRKPWMVTADAVAHP